MFVPVPPVTIFLLLKPMLVLIAQVGTTEEYLREELVLSLTEVSDPPTRQLKQSYPNKYSLIAHN